MRKSGLIVFLFALLLAAPAFAQSADEALGRLAAPGFDEIEKGIRDLAASGDPRAEPVLSALSDGRLLARPDHHLLVKDRDGTVRDAATGAPADAAGAKPVRVNNRLRRALDAAVGTLTLRSPDRAKRLAAAQSVFAQPDPETLPAVERQLADEKDPSVRAALLQARGAILLDKGATPEARRDGAATLAGSPSPEALNKLQAALLGLPADADPQLKAAAPGRHRLDPAAAPAPGPRPQPLPGDQPRLGAAAGGDRARHHVRRDGRHQHGARRDGDARRLHGLRRAGGLPGLVAGRARGLAADRPPPRLPGHRRRGRRDRAHDHQPALRPAARDAARHLGPVADAAAGGADPVRGQQPRGLGPGLDERARRARRRAST